MSCQLYWNFNNYKIIEQKGEDIEVTVVSSPVSLSNVENDSLFQLNGHLILDIIKTNMEKKDDFHENYNITFSINNQVIGSLYVVTDYTQSSSGGFQTLLNNISGTISCKGIFSDFNNGTAIIEYNNDTGKRCLTIYKKSSIESSSKKKGTKSISYLNHIYTFNPENNLYYVFNVDKPDALIENNPDVSFRYTDIDSLTDETWNNFTDNIIVFEGVRIRYTPPSSDVQTLYFRETIQIKNADGSSIRASAIYEDSGDNELTTVNTAYFPVECASGKFKDVKIIKFNYFNDYEPNKNVRRLELLM